MPNCDVTAWIAGVVLLCFGASMVLSTCLLNCCLTNQIVARYARVDKAE